MKLLNIFFKSKVGKQVKFEEDFDTLFTNKTFDESLEIASKFLSSEYSKEKIIDGVRSINKNILFNDFNNYISQNNLSTKGVKKICPEVVKVKSDYWKNDDISIDDFIVEVKEMYGIENIPEGLNLDEIILYNHFEIINTEELSEYLMQRAIIRIVKSQSEVLIYKPNNVAHSIPIKYALHKYFDQIFTLKESVSFISKFLLFKTHFLNNLKYHEQNKYFRPHYFIN